MPNIRPKSKRGKRYEEAERAAKVLREIINITMTKVERIEYDQEVADLRAGMDDQAFLSFWAEGRAMTMEQAIELALEKPST